ncbi:acyl-CoA N-acyltransferase [Striga asiatica]|uniref:Acyl-CoA N-acyltransferase n=1 Tax=Striga asiatica TaxID=4170 RepID=A0A5A7RDY3_STRAF|nr:acyl-CoA N-acyltransferase [Striga asiatica]
MIAVGFSGEWAQSSVPLPIPYAVNYLEIQIRESDKSPKSHDVCGFSRPPDADLDCFIGDMDPGEIVVTSIKPGLKREYNMMMKAQGELIRSSREGGRVTRSLSASGSRRANTRSGGMINRKVKGSVPKKMKKDKKGSEEEPEVPEKDGAQVESTIECESRNLEPEFIIVDGTLTQELQPNSREEEDVRMLENGENLDIVEVPMGDVVQAQSNLGNDSRSLEAELVAVESSEAEKKVGADYKEAVDPQVLGIELPSSQGGVSDIDFTHEGEKTNEGVSDLGCEIIGEATSRTEEKPLRRHTRDLKQQQEESFLEAPTRESKSAATLTDSRCKREMKMSKKVELRKVPLRLKDLLETGLLEGLSVRYINGSKRRRHPDTELQGVIRAAGILCKCSECKGKEMGLEQIFHVFLFMFPGLIPESGAGRQMLLCDSCVLPKDSDPGHIQSSEVTPRSPFVGSSPPVVSVCQPEVPESARLSSHKQPQSQSKRQGKLTRKDLKMHKSVLMEDLLPDGTTLSYVMHGKFCFSLFREGLKVIRKMVLSSAHVAIDWYGDVVMCEKEYHISCLKEQGIADLDELPEGEWFCSERCSTIHVALQNFIGAGEQSLPEDLLNILRGKIETQNPSQDIDTKGLSQDIDAKDPSQDIDAKDPSQDIDAKGPSQDIEAKGPSQDIDAKGPSQDVDIRWRLLNGKKASEDTRVWLSGAVSIFHDRFDPIADSSTGRLDLIPHMVYGRAFKDQDFCGMYCAMLMVGSVVVSAGIVRIFGEEIAELPLVATKSEYQGKGYFQSLYFCLERLLASLGVKGLVLAAADEAESLWTNRFGFAKLGEEEVVIIGRVPEEVSNDDIPGHIRSSQGDHECVKTVAFFLFFWVHVQKLKGVFASSVGNLKLHSLLLDFCPYS